MASGVSTGLVPGRVFDIPSWAGGERRLRLCRWFLPSLVSAESISLLGATKWPSLVPPKHFPAGWTWLPVLSLGEPVRLPQLAQRSWVLA